MTSSSDTSYQCDPVIPMVLEGASQLTAGIGPVKKAE